jgi:hypothetical protein
VSPLILKGALKKTLFIINRIGECIVNTLPTIQYTLNESTPSIIFPKPPPLFKQFGGFHYTLFIHIYVIYFEPCYLPVPSLILLPVISNSCNPPFAFRFHIKIIIFYYCYHIITNSSKLLLF